MSNILQTRLESGLTIVTDPMSTVESASIGIWVDTGTRFEPAHINGVSHLLEHMAFKGTERRSALQIAEEMDNVGGHLNAYTARDHTAYYAKVLKPDTGLALDILADLLQNSTMDEAELAREREVVVQEIGQANDTPDDIIFDHFQEVAYPDQPLGRPVLGTAELVRSMQRDTVLDYMREHYSGPRMIVAASGAVDHNAIVDQARAAFANLKSDCPKAPEPARYVGGDFREERDIEQVNVVLGFEGVSHLDPDYYASSVLSTLLGGGMSSRLFQEIREKRGLVYSVYSFTAAYNDGGVFGIYAGTGESEVTELMPVMCDEVLKVTQGVTEAELHRARAQLKSSILMSLESTTSRCEQIARQLQVYGHLNTTHEIVAKLEAVTADDITRAAKRIFSTTPTLSVIGPLANVESYDQIKARLQH